jgi:two-component system phosphate regulon sensor histidine kinase PhoR
VTGYGNARPGPASIIRVLFLRFVDASMSSASVLDRWLPAAVNRVALKIALPVVAVVALGAALPLGWPLGRALLTGLGVGGVTYAAAHYWLHRRLKDTQAALRQIRQHAFEDLAAPSGPRGDELNTLIWEVYRTGQKLDNEIQDLKERESYRREFIGNVSHELKTPIFSVQGFTETLLDGALDDEEVNRTFLEKILHNVTRLENLARDLSAITKIETGEMEMTSEQFDLAEVFEEVQDSLELKANNKNVALRTELDDGLSCVYGDRDRIRRVIVNLADNAIKYNEDGGTVLLRATSHGADEVEVNVADDGIGIPSEHLPRLTERFYRVDKSRSRNQGGTGLGLAIVKHILGAHDRNLHVESTPGEGSTFGFTLPTTPQPALQSAG